MGLDIRVEHDLIGNCAIDADLYYGVRMRRAIAARIAVWNATDALLGALDGLRSACQAKAEAFTGPKTTWIRHG